MIGKKIKRLRQKKGYSITELGRLADVSKSYLSQLERGLQTNPSLHFLVKVSKPLDTSIDYLLQNANEQKVEDNLLDEEWKELIQQAIEDGLKKEDFHEYRKYIKFQEWMKEQKKS
ncbi:helix-turn-helix domain-containing protein [Bacillus sp. OK048]|uniref:helix-turn-helix domain-containing protein n=1 Tax=Bacillus sp. OK048 TaxID=1882761 RepID=UPI00087E8AE3|nr:helix-turn-helix domain-containing protein [Bacillus sp. OK048]SDL91239.1 XRE family transcriptional regulator, master regulator for biofilm formation [Bacillus sp. OK048]